jgi:hypothetical protein
MTPMARLAQLLTALADDRIWHYNGALVWIRKVREDGRLEVVRAPFGRPEFNATESVVVELDDLSPSAWRAARQVM